MKLLIVSQYWFPENGVPQRRWNWLTGILKKQGHEVFVITPPANYNRRITFKEWWAVKGYRASLAVEEGPSSEVIFRTAFLPISRSLTSKAVGQLFVSVASVIALKRVKKELSGEQLDLVIGTIPALPTALVTFIAAKAFGVRYVIDLRDAWPDLFSYSQSWNHSLRRRSLWEKFVQTGPLQIAIGITRTVLNGVLRNSSSIVVTSENLRDSLRLREELRHHGQLPEVHLLRNTFPVESTVDATARHEAVKSRPQGTLRVLYAGTIGRAQDLSNVIAAANIAQELGVDLSVRFVGTGAARKTLEMLAESSTVKIEFIDRAPSNELGRHYEWADSALVHLTDWEPLSRAVPSKTYELMELGIHITGVVAGETARIIAEHQAGDVVPPEAPQALARLWYQLSQDRDRLLVGKDSAAWVRSTRNVRASETLRALLKEG